MSGDGRRSRDSWLKVSVSSNSFLDGTTQILPPHLSILPHLLDGGRLEKTRWAFTRQDSSPSNHVADLESMALLVAIDWEGLAL